MVKRCLELNQAFGVIRSGNDGLSEIGTLAEIREATRYIDGRWDIVALGTQRFRVTNFDRSAPYLQAEVELLNEAVGEPAERVRATAERVSDLFIDYLELLRGVDEGDHDHDHDDDDEEEEGEYIEDDEVTPKRLMRRWKRSRVRRSAKRSSPRSNVSLWRRTPPLGLPRSPSTTSVMTSLRTTKATPMASCSQRPSIAFRGATTPLASRTLLAVWCS